MKKLFLIITIPFFVLWICVAGLSIIAGFILSPMVHGFKNGLEQFNDFRDWADRLNNSLKKD